jgi:hypothetical protein
MLEWEALQFEQRISDSHTAGINLFVVLASMP